MLIEVDAIATEVNAPGHAVGACQKGVGVQNNDPIFSFRPGLQQLYGLVYGLVVLGVQQRFQWCEDVKSASNAVGGIQFNQFADGGGQLCRRFVVADMKFALPGSNTTVSGW